MANTAAQLKREEKMLCNQSIDHRRDRSVPGSTVVLVRMIFNFSHLLETFLEAFLSFYLQSSNVYKPQIIIIVNKFSAAYIRLETFLETIRNRNFALSN